MDETGESESSQADIHTTDGIEARELSDLPAVQDAEKREAPKQQQITRLENKPARPILQATPC